MGRGGNWPERKIALEPAGFLLASASLLVFAASTTENQRGAWRFRASQVGRRLGLWRVFVAEETGAHERALQARLEALTTSP